MEVVGAQHLEGEEPQGQHRVHDRELDDIDRHGDGEPRIERDEAGRAGEAVGPVGDDVEDCADPGLEAHPAGHLAVGHVADPVDEVGRDQQAGARVGQGRHREEE